ncbi:hypothetical protein HF086_000495 [Spodoptera exigua]|uniref:Uncharacterized protein n=1 Tax=Spodoptera exigua TaxID=7107 RepID=A0A922MT74_SPOEX|nr:hypothetical protein HF086_000495 [Spodoptera exigua]
MSVCAGPPAVQYENAILQLAPVDKGKCPYVHAGSDVSFQLYTRHNPTVPQRLALGDDELLFASSMDWAAPTVLYFHAFMEQPDDGSAVLVREGTVDPCCTIPSTGALRLYTNGTAGRSVHAARRLQRHHGGRGAAGGGSLVPGGGAQHVVRGAVRGAHAGLPGGAGAAPQRHAPGYKHPLGHADFFPNGGASPQPGCELEVVLPQQLLLNKCEYPHIYSYTRYTGDRGLLQPLALVPILRGVRAPAARLPRHALRHLAGLHARTLRRRPHRPHGTRRPPHVSPPPPHRTYSARLAQHASTTHACRCAPPPPPQAVPAGAAQGARPRPRAPRLAGAGRAGGAAAGAPLVSVARVVSTRVTSRAGELAHVARETARYIGRDAPPPPAASLQVGGGWLGGGARLSVSR